ncbi:MAG: class I SAM-dependent methyltransferase [Pleurocapsa sp.]
MKHYAIAGGAEGKSRLKVLSGVMQPYTLSFLQGLRIEPGMHCLDLGCGGGDVTFELAALLGKEGKVVGWELDETIVKLNREDCQKLNLTNVEFEIADAFSLDEVNKYDLTYTRFLLTHLSDPQTVIEKLKTAVKPGGIVAVEDIEFAGHFCYPKSLAFDKYIELYQQVVRNKGGDSEIGVKLPGMFKKAGFEEVGFNLVQPALMTGEGKLVAPITIEKIRNAVLEQDLSSPDEIDGLIAELNKLAQNPETIISLPRIFQVWGTKK